MPPKKFKCAFHYKEPDDDWCLEAQEAAPKYCAKIKCPKFRGNKKWL